jgi:hypothetical protein
MSIDDDRIAALGAVLLRVRSSARLIQRMVGKFRDGTVPLPHCCHANAARFVEDFPDAKEVAGWLIFDLTNPALLFLRQPLRFEFVAHTVVERANGDLIDITPPPDLEAGHYPFLRHPHSDQDFAELDGLSVARVIVFLGDPPRFAHRSN